MTIGSIKSLIKPISLLIIFLCSPSIFSMHCSSSVTHSPSPSLTPCESEQGKEKLRVQCESVIRSSSPKQKSENEKLKEQLAEEVVHKKELAGELYEAVKENEALKAELHKEVARENALNRKLNKKDEELMEQTAYIRDIANELFEAYVELIMQSNGILKDRYNRYSMPLSNGGTLNASSNDGEYRCFAILKNENGEEKRVIFNQYFARRLFETFEKRYSICEKTEKEGQARRPACVSGSSCSSATPATTTTAFTISPSTTATVTAIVAAVTAIAVAHTGGLMSSTK